MKSIDINKLENKKVKASQSISLYIRNNRKQALLVHINDQTKLNHIRKAVAYRFNIPVSNQIFYYKQYQIRNEEIFKSIKFKQQGIVHVINYGNIKEHLTIKIKDNLKNTVGINQIQSK